MNNFDENNKRTNLLDNSASIISTRNINNDLTLPLTDIMIDSTPLNKNLNTIKDFEKFKEICSIAFPTMLFFICLFLLQTINLTFVGHLIEDEQKKKDALDAIGISHIYINCSIISIISGLISGLETLGSNAFGAKKYKLLGLYLHRAQIISYGLVTIFLTFHYFFSLKIFVMMGIKDNIIININKYIKIAFLFCLVDVQFSLNFRYLNIIGKSFVNFICLLVSLILHPVWCYIFMVQLGYIIEGAAVALVISQLINSILGTIYLYFINPLPESIFCFNRNSFRGFWEYLKISIPSAFLSCVEWWAFEILSIIAVSIGQTDFTIHIFLCNISVNLLTITIGFGASTGILVGREFGKGDIESARAFFKIAMFYGFVLDLFFNIILFIFRYKLLSLFGVEQNLNDKAASIIIILCISNLFGYCYSIFTSLYKGLGKQLLASGISLGNFYIIQVGLGLLFTKYFEMGVSGLWLAVLITYVVCCSIYSIIFSNLDLGKILNETKKRINSDNKLAESSDFSHNKLVEETDF